MFFDTLQRGAVYEILRGFVDAHGDTIATGERLTFVKSNYFPHDNGLTLYFRERNICLEMSGAVAKSPSLYIRLIQEARPEATLTVADLKPGATYEAIDTFLDADRNWISEGDRLVFLALETDAQGNHTLRFKDRRLECTKGDEIAVRTHHYLRPVDG